MIKILSIITCENCDEDSQLKKVEHEDDLHIMCSNCIRVIEKKEAKKEAEECRGDYLRQVQKDERLLNEKKEL